MKYFTSKPILAAMQRITDEHSRYEHRVGTVAATIMPMYFPADKFTITPEQIQIGTRKRPDLTIESLENVNGVDKLILHCFVELKSLVNSNFDDILDQLSDSIQFALDDNPNTSAFIIAIKGLKIAFYTYHNCIDILEQGKGLIHYKGFVPLPYVFSFKDYISVNPESNPIDFLRHIVKLPGIPDTESLINQGVGKTDKLDTPHIFDLLKHKEYVHLLFEHASKNKPGLDILD